MAGASILTQSMTIADASGRSSLFLSTISSTLIALAFIGQISRLGTAFFIFALVLFPSLFFLGLVTFERVLQSAIEDIVCARGINRIRHFYVELAPQVKDYFIHSIHDDEAGAHGNMCMQMSWWQLFLTTAGMIAVIDSLLVGACAGLLIYQLFASPLLPCLSAAIVIFLVVLVAHQRYQWVCWRRADRHQKVLFPSDAEPAGATDRSQDLWVQSRTRHLSRARTEQTEHEVQPVSRRGPDDSRPRTGPIC